MTKTLLLDCGSGGRASQRLINELFLEQFDNPILRTLDDAAKLELSGPIAMSTDGYTVTPLFFPGGNIGTLAVHGTVNDVSMLGARPRYLTCGFILEEGLDLDLLRKVVESMAEAARSAGVLIVSGDTKVVPRGACDKLFITTAGVGEILADPSPVRQRRAARRRHSGERGRGRSRACRARAARQPFVPARRRERQRRAQQDGGTPDA